MLATYIALTILALMISGLIFAVVMLFKNEATYRNHMILVNAIFLYRMDVCEHHDYSTCDVPHYEVSWGDMARYNKTLFRLWDWGYTRILPADKFEIIKPYIAKAKEMK